MEMWERSIVVHHVCCECEPLFAAGLMSNSRLGVFPGEPSQGDKALYRNLDRAVDHNGCRQSVTRVLGQQWDIQNNAMIGGKLLVDSPAHLPSDRWMHDVVQVSEGLGIAKCQRCERRPIQGPIRTKDARPEALG